MTDGRALARQFAVLLCLIPGWPEFFAWQMDTLVTTIRDLDLSPPVREAWLGLPKGEGRQ